MVSVLLEDENIRVHVNAGMSLREIARKAGSSMEFGCRVGDCSTCVAYVKSGIELLSAKQEKEEQVLKMLGTPAMHLRLMCQCSVQADEGEIVISYCS